MRRVLPGRPTKAESAERDRELLRLISNGTPLHEAARAARVTPERVLRLLDEDPVFFAAYCAFRGPVSVAA